VEAVFSKAYLEKEFPGFYGAPPAGGEPPREHPANQLRGFINLQGREGWQLLGVYPVGVLQMMIFRRPLAAAEAKAAQSEARPSPPAVATGQAVAAGTTEAGGGSEAMPAQASGLERILERLEALEGRLSTPPLPQASTVARAEPDGLAGLQDGEILPPGCWSELDGQPRLSTPEAARALGFRSAATLLNLAARSGYRQGLVKRGVQAALGVYVGSEKSGRGGRDRRLWVVLRLSGG
jgi:hypothetical protein